MKKEYIICFEMNNTAVGIKYLHPIETTFRTPELAEKGVENLLTKSPEMILYILPRYSKA